MSLFIQLPVGQQSSGRYFLEENMQSLKTIPINIWNYTGKVLFVLSESKGCKWEAPSPREREKNGSGVPFSLSLP